ncbi:histidine phosphatase family protein [Microbispora sp. H10836]|uniref:histidine phosphatase family protein n=1 Tax=Microbispora sp. H10836 TaxID=2729106 RepID=UPI0020166B9A|nr:histidine phosphatase family protein [Microbispora sp. H10836]
MTTRRLYLARHGAADAFGELTGIGRRQAGLLGERLAGVPVDAVWHSPLPRAVASAHELARHLPNVPVTEAAELVDHVPYVPSAAETPPSWAGFFDGYDDTEAASGRRLAEALVARFAKVPGTTTKGTRSDTREVLVTHAYQIAWLVRHALDAPPSRWPAAHARDVQRHEPPPARPTLDRVPRRRQTVRWLPTGPEVAACVSARVVESFITSRFARGAGRARNARWVRSRSAKRHRGSRSPLDGPR